MGPRRWREDSQGAEGRQVGVASPGHSQTGMAARPPWAAGQSTDPGSSPQAPHSHPEGVWPHWVGHAFPLGSPRLAGPEPSSSSRSDGRREQGFVGNVSTATAAADQRPAAPRVVCLRGGSEGDGRGRAWGPCPGLEGEASGAGPGQAALLCVGGPELRSAEKHLRARGPEVPHCRQGPWATERSQHRAQARAALSPCEADIGFPSPTPLTVVAQKDP